MGEQKFFEEEMVRVLDILEQIKELNRMISMHEEKSGDKLMAYQYRDLKNRFLKELKGILKTYDIEVQIQDKAA